MTKDGDDHSHQPHTSRAASGQVGSEGKRAEDHEDDAEVAGEEVLEHVAVGGDVARPGLEVGARVGLGVEAREEGQRPIEGQA